MQVAISEFKAKCSEYVRKLPDLDQPIEVTNRGKIVAVVSYPKQEKQKNPIFGLLKNTVTYIVEDFDEPLGDSEWEAAGDEIST